MKIILILYLMFGAFNVPLHQDTIIILKEDGTLLGLPDKYSPARFEKSDFILELGRNRIKIPNCVTNYFISATNPKFSFTASWYHIRPKIRNYNSLPNYISLIVSNIESHSDIQILFNLDTLEILKINKIEKHVTVGGVNYSLYYNEQKISKTCKKEILSSIIKK